MAVELNGLIVGVDKGVLTVIDIVNTTKYKFDSNIDINILTIQGQESLVELNKLLKVLSISLSKSSSNELSSINNELKGLGKIRKVEDCISIYIDIKLATTDIGYGLVMSSSLNSLYVYTYNKTREGYSIDSGLYVVVNYIGNTLLGESNILLDTKGNIHYYNSNIGLCRVCNLNNRTKITLTVDTLEDTDLQVVSVLDKNNNIIGNITVTDW